jgi:hypothetical protein
MKTFAKMSYQEQRQAGQEYLKKHGLTDWTFDVVNLSNEDMCSERLWGGCKFDLKRITVHFGVGRQFRQTILHEIAHALVGKAADHGPDWQNKAGEIGCTFAHLWPYRNCTSLPAVATK